MQLGLDLTQSEDLGTLLHPKLTLKKFGLHAWGNDLDFSHAFQLSYFISAYVRFVDSQERRDQASYLMLVAAIQRWIAGVEFVRWILEGGLCDLVNASYPLV